MCTTNSPITYWIYWIVSIHNLVCNDLQPAAAIFIFKTRKNYTGLRGYRELCSNMSEVPILKITSRFRKIRWNNALRPLKFPSRFSELTIRWNYVITWKRDTKINWSSHLSIRRTYNAAFRIQPYAQGAPPNTEM